LQGHLLAEPATTLSGDTQKHTNLMRAVCVHSQNGNILDTSRDWQTVFSFTGYFGRTGYKWR